MPYNNHYTSVQVVQHQLNPFSQVSGYYVPVSAAPQQVQINPVYNSYQTNPSFYQANQPQHIVPNYYQNPNLSQQYTPNIHQLQLQQQTQQHEAYMYHHQLQQQHQRQNEILLQQQQQQQQSQYNQQYFMQTNQQQQIQNLVKSEPYDPNPQNNSANESSNNPYFTNPIPFKQEPKEEPMENNNDQGNDDSNGLKIVSQLLRDKQVLNQLEKVAQSFRIS